MTSFNEYISIHRKLFQGIYKHTGKIRDYNITKKERVLDGATVMYGNASGIKIMANPYLWRRQYEAF